MSVTIRKIAKDLKLAVSTVSKALRDSYEISEDTKQLVLNYAREIGYVPNPYAGSLKSGLTRNIAVVIPEVADSFFSNAINGIDSVAQDKGYHVMIYLTHEDKNIEESILKNLKSGRVDGVLISVSMGVQEDSPVHAGLARELPLVFFDRVCEQVEAAKVVTDDFEASYRATVHLLERGCMEVVFLAAAGGLSIIDQRCKGFARALSDHGREVTNRHIVTCPLDDEESLKVISGVLARSERVDGVIGSVEKLATSTYTACHQKGLNIPDDVKVIGFSNLQIAPLLAPALSTVEQPSFRMGEAAATLLFNALAKKVDLRKEKVVIPSALHQRDSTLAFRLVS